MTRLHSLKNVQNAERATADRELKRLKTTRKMCSSATVPFSLSDGQAFARAGLDSDQSLKVQRVVDAHEAPPLSVLLITQMQGRRRVCSHKNSAGPAAPAQSDGQRMPPEGAPHKLPPFPSTTHEPQTNFSAGMMRENRPMQLTQSPRPPMVQSIAAIVVANWFSSRHDKGRSTHAIDGLRLMVGRTLRPLGLPVYPFPGLLTRCCPTALLQVVRALGGERPVVTHPACLAQRHFNGRQPVVVGGAHG